MKFTPSTTEPMLNTDILIKLNNSMVHEGEYVKVLDKDDKAQAFYHLYKTNEYLTPMMVSAWKPISEITDHYYAENVEY